MTNNLTIGKTGSHVYNAADKRGYGRGYRVVNNKIVNDKNIQLVYTVIGFDGEYAICESYDIFGVRYEEKLPIVNLEPYSKNQVAFSNVE